jgi:hypothetical protein
LRLIEIKESIGEIEGRGKSIVGTGIITIVEVDSGVRLSSFLSKYEVGNHHLLKEMV